MSEEPERLLQCERFYVERVTQLGRDGQPRQREIVRHPGSVVILPLLDDGQSVCLIENQRIAVGQKLLELPAGTREPNEPADVTARRELQEETGYQSDDWERVTTFFAAPGILDEQMVFYIARDIVAGAPDREMGELIENRIVTIESAIELIAAGTICDAKTIIGLLWWKSFAGGTA